MTETLDAGDAELTIDHQAGGRISSFRIGGHELLVGRTPTNGVGRNETEWGCFPMVPWAGRIRHGHFDHVGRAIDLRRNLPPHAIHGTTHHQPWTRTGPGILETDLGTDWPWPGWARQAVELSADRLSMTIEVGADPAAPDAMPVSAGWHPWFRRYVAGATLAVTVPAERMWRRDAEGIPDGDLIEPTPGPWDDCFTALVGPAELHWPGLFRLYVESDCEHVVVYDEQVEAVCVEPQSAPPDAHNSGEDLVLVDPGDSWSITTTWLWAMD